MEPSNGWFELDDDPKNRIVNWLSQKMKRHEKIEYFLEIQHFLTPAIDFQSDRKKYILSAHLRNQEKHI